MESSPDKKSSKTYPIYYLALLFTGCTLHFIIASLLSNLGLKGSRHELD